MNSDSDWTNSTSDASGYLEYLPCATYAIGMNGKGLIVCTVEVSRWVHGSCIGSHMLLYSECTNECTVTDG